MLTGVLLFFIIGLCYGHDANVKLKEVLVLSRHNIRTPLTDNLERFTPKKWPEWENEAGVLTKKGAIMEGYMGEYFYQWLNKEGVLPSGCPEIDTVFIYANTKDRTKESAKAFANSAFRNCNVKVHFKNITTMDPVFNPVIHNNSHEFKQICLAEMEDKLFNVNLTSSFKELDDIIDIKNSYVCKEELYCDLLDKDQIIYKIGIEPNITGPLHIGNAVVDAFIMCFYDGKPMEDVAWGKITKPEQWELLTHVTKENQNVRFNLPNMAKDLAWPLLNYISETFVNNNNGRKFTLLMGHDSNLNTVITALRFKPFELKMQYEPFPIGGKLVFQKWTDGEKDFLKVEYIYQSWTQLRESVKISLEVPPLRVQMELRDCAINENGLCLWEDFLNILKEYL